MDYKKLPIGIQGFIHFMEDAKNFDSTYNSRIYNKEINYMIESEDMYSKFGVNRELPEEELIEILKTVMQRQDGVLDLLDEWWVFREKGAKKKDLELYEFKMKIKLAEFYNYLGLKLHELGILRLLVRRTNKNFEREDLEELCITEHNALKEFDIKENSRCDRTGILFCKNAYALNKLAKFVERFEYGAMISRDEKKAKINNIHRIQFLSKMKTDFLRKVCDNVDIKEIDFYTYQEIYENLFGEFFDNLDFASDFELLSNYEVCKKRIYFDKSIQLSMGISDLLFLQDFNKRSKNIKRWGCCKDTSDGSYIFGLDLYGYPMSLTFHLQEIDLKEMQRQYKSGHYLETKFPEYTLARDSSGNVLSSNALFKVTSIQRDIINELFEGRPFNPVLKFMKSQIAQGEPEKPRKYISLEEMIK